MAVILYDDVGVFVLDAFGQAAQEGRTADAGHILEADLVAAVFHHFVHYVHIVLDGMDGGVGDAEGYLGDHAALLGEDDGVLEVAVVVEAAERAGDVGSLLGLHFIHEPPHIPGYGIHTEGVEASLQHVCLNTDFVERGGPCSYGFVGVLAEEEVYLLESSSVGLYSVEASHIDDDRGDLDKLVNPRNIFS